jgi:hypothetical protein
MKRLAQSRGGKFLSTEYVNVDTKHIWRCKENHIWEAAPKDIKRGQWCPTCSIGVSERICRAYFENIFNKKFSRTRPKWLINSKGNKLELDGYNKELQLAFEYHGKQHFKHIKAWHKKRTLEQQKEDDMAKRNLCKFRGIVLIEVPYTIKFEEIGKYIIRQCELNDIVVPNKNINTDYKQFDIYSRQYLKEMKNIAKSKGGICLSTNYVNAKTKLKFQCKEGHLWIAAPNHIKEGHWCRKCHIIKKSSNKI